MPRKRQQQQFSLDDFLRNNLQQSIERRKGTEYIEAVEIPSFLKESLNPRISLRDYQKEAFKYFITFWENRDVFGKYPIHLLFLMATGSGKTLIMAGIILYLYKQGYRNFLFFVSRKNIIVKTIENFFNPTSSKYLFGQTITIDNKRVVLRQVDNFQGSDPDAINICLKTSQGIHGDLNNPKENEISFADFSGSKIVMIADEAHHLNSSTKKADYSPFFSMPFVDYTDDNTPCTGWEDATNRILRANPENVLIEFTATQDFENSNIREKYKDKIIYHYSLRDFCRNKYSKDVDVLQSDLLPINRALQAVIMSQFRLKLANSINQNIKPVIMFKCPNIKTNKGFFIKFINRIRLLTPEHLLQIKKKNNADVNYAFDYFDAHGIKLENLVLEIKEDFKEENLLIIDSLDINEDKQHLLNSLENDDNAIRAIFSVDMLDEGWDVLNLFDIVRFSDNWVGESVTPNSEAQLIGRGARYMPFSAVGARPSGESDEQFSEYLGKRKFDGEIANPLRYLEKLLYHSLYNPRYIRDLKDALAKSGLIHNKSIRIEERLKPEFKNSILYNKGYVFVNRRIEDRSSKIKGVKKILQQTFDVSLPTGKSVTSNVFSDSDTDLGANNVVNTFRLLDFGPHVVRAALNSFDNFSFEELRKIFPELDSIRRFIESPEYLADIRVQIIGEENLRNKLSQSNKLYIVTEVLSKVLPMLSAESVKAVGSKEFFPLSVKDTFIDYSYNVVLGSEAEYGVSMKTTNNNALRCDLSKEDWYGYEDNFGTDEEKHLIRYIQSIIPKLREKYSEIYLLRNYKRIKIYTFSDGRATEPDFVMFLRKKDSDTEFDNIQIFIEPKGEYLSKNDEWKEKFEMSIHDEARITFATSSDRFEIWGMPFYIHSRPQKFENEMKTHFL